MRRLAVCLVVLALSLVASPAQAAAGVHVEFAHTTLAFAVWDDPQTGLFAVAEVFPPEDYLILIVRVPVLDADGNVIGQYEADLDANLSSYGSLTLPPSLTSAQLKLTKVPASFCAFPVGDCTTTTIDASISWTGASKLAHDTFTSHSVIHVAGHLLLSNYLDAEFERDAIASGTIGGASLGATEDADLKRGVSGSVDLCVGPRC